jgi:hypothetical protein
LALLVNCGGSGSSDSSDAKENNPYSFANLEAAFPPFSVPENANLSRVEKRKTYKVTRSVFDEFITRVFGDNNPSNATLYTRYDSNLNINYEARHLPPASLTMMMYSASNFDNLTDNVFENVFGVVDGNFSSVEITYKRDANLSLEIDNYMAALSSSYGFNCDNIVCEKLSDDGLLAYRFYKLSAGYVYGANAN